MPIFLVFGPPKNETQKRLTTFRRRLIKIPINKDYLPAGNKSISCNITSEAIEGEAKFITVFIHSLPSNTLINSSNHGEIKKEVRRICKEFYPKAKIRVNIVPFADISGFNYQGE